MGPVPVALPWAVHISDGVLAWPWWVGGFALAAVLALAAAYRVRDEEVPRIALLTAAFFVASLIHVRAGPTSVHLVLNGLVGVLLGRRAALAIPLAVALQMVLLGHGGFTTVGVNACVMTLPALLAGSLFGLLHRVRWVRHPWFRAGLVVAGALPWMLSLVFSVALVSLNLSVPRAGQVTFHPVTLAAVGLLALLLARAERRLDNAPEFPLGLLAGVLAVLATSALNAAVLLWGGAEDWHTIALLVFVAHLPVVVIEGVVVGFTVGFLARVKPEMLGSYTTAGSRGPLPQGQAAPSANGIAHPPAGITPAAGPAPSPITLRPPALLLAVLGVLWAAGPAHAHRLEADCQVLPGGRVQIESWFDPGDGRPRGARVQVFRPDGSLLAEGKTDDQGVFVFSCREAEPLRVVVNAGAGHRKEFMILKEKLEQVALPGTQGPPPPSHPSRVSIKDVLIGVGFLLALAAFVLSLRNARRLDKLTRCLLAPLCGLLVLAAGPARAAGGFALRDGDRVVLLGNTLIEREQRDGYWETALTSRYPDRNLLFRNLGWSGDTVFGEARAGFGSPADGFRHLKEHVLSLKPTVILVGYGSNEAFEGPAGLPRFTKGLEVLLDTIAPTRARIVLLSPLRQEDLGRPLPDPVAQNKNLRLYAGALRDTARKRGLLFVDLYDLLGDGAKATPPVPLTDNGIHLTSFGYWQSAPVLERGLGLTGPRWQVAFHGGGKEPAAEGATVRRIEGRLLSFRVTDQTLPAPPPPADGMPKGFTPAAERVLRVRDLRPGSYTLAVDGKPVATATAAEWAAGVSLRRGPEFEQAEQLRKAIVAKDLLYFHRWRPQNVTYLFGFRKHEQGQNAREVPQFDPLVAKQEAEIARLRVPVAHTYELTAPESRPTAPESRPTEAKR